MKRCVWYNNRDIRLEEVSRPVPSAGEILVRVMACGICGSDVVEWYRLPKAPLVPGHEAVGEVVEAGRGVREFSPGDRVFMAPKVPCMHCTWCRRKQYPLCTEVKERLPGGLAEFVAVPAALVKNGTYRLPDSLTWDQSTFIEPLACVVRAQRLGGVEKDRSLMVVGCGMSGLLHIQLAKAGGCPEIVAVDINPDKLAMARGFGADRCLEAREDAAGVLSAEGIGKPDIVMLCAGAVAAVETAWACVAKGGAVVFFAVPAPDRQVVVPVNALWTKEVRILTSYYCGPPDIVEAMALIESGAVAVDGMITHRLPLDKAAEGFRLVQEGRQSIKVIVHPQAVSPESINRQ